MQRADNQNREAKVWERSSGQALIEYLLVLMLLVVVVILVVEGIGKTVNNAYYEKVNSALGGQ
ncbi:MAG TPA: hypothetical protein VIK40_10090 [Geomonas sp.]